MYEQNLAQATFPSGISTSLDLNLELYTRLLVWIDLSCTLDSIAFWIFCFATLSLGNLFNLQVSIDSPSISLPRDLLFESSLASSID